MSRLITAIAVLAITALGCRAADTSNLTEVQRVRSGSLDVIVLSPLGQLTHGNDLFFIEFRTPDGTLVDAGDVRASATMPMPSMPMLGSIGVKRTDVVGRYAATSQFEMAGTWRTTIEWKGAAGEGSATLAASVR